MAPKFDTSFIPKQSQQPQQSGGGRSGGTSFVGIFSLIALIIFLGSVAAGVGVFLYEQYLERTIADKEQSLERAKDAFDPDLITELKRLDVRLDSAETLLDEHTALSVFFRELETVTLETVRFTSFDFTAEANTATVEMEGEAQSFADVALQTQRFTDSEVIANSVFSNLNVNEEGAVTFSVAATLNRDEFRYVNNLEQYEGTTTPDISDS